MPEIKRQNRTCPAARLPPVRAAHQKAEIKISPSAVVGGRRQKAAASQRLIIPVSLKREPNATEAGS